MGDKIKTMSTTFGVNILKKRIQLIDDEMPPGIDHDEFVKVAFRGNLTGIKWVNEIAELLPNYIRVYPLNNTAQGIYTIGDIRREIESQKENQVKP